MVMHGVIDGFIRHIQAKLLLEPRTHTLIALKAFWTSELCAQVRQRLALNARLLATAMPFLRHAPRSGNAAIQARAIGTKNGVSEKN